MVNWQDPAIQVFDGYVALVLMHISAGFYFWEFLISLWFDWKHITQKGALRWTSLPYFLTRYPVMIGLITALAITTSRNEVPHCSPLWKFITGVNLLSVSMASLLFALRIIALYNRNIWITGIFIVIWLVEFAMLIHGIVLAEGIYIPPLYACALVQNAPIRYSFFAPFGVDIFCLVALLIILYKNRGAGLWRLLVSQGVIYFVVILIFHVPTATLISLNMNDGMYTMMEFPAIVAMVAASTRMYRDLRDFGNTTVDTFSMPTRVNSSSYGQPRKNTDVVLPMGNLARGGQRQAPMPSTLVGSSGIPSSTQKASSMTMFDDASDV